MIKRFHAFNSLVDFCADELRDTVGRNRKMSEVEDYADWILNQTARVVDELSDGDEDPVDGCNLK
jgi:hypothetical protein